MKFGKVLQQSMQVSSQSWENNWVDYKQLKHIIKDCAQIKKEEKLEGSKLVKTKIKPNAKEDNDSIRTSPDEKNFFLTLRSEIKKIADFFIKEQAAYVGRVKEIDAQFVELQSNPQPETKTALMKSCVALYKELLLLENYAVMNFCGISKILKKHDKWTGYATRNKFMRTILMKQPFATYMPLLQMIDRLEQIFMEATGCSIDQHDTHKRSHRHQLAANASVLTPTSSSSTPAASRTSPTGSQNESPTNQARRSAGSPPDDAVSLLRVNELRHDAHHFRQTEDCYDGDDDGEGDSAEDGDDVASTQSQRSPERVEPATSSAPAASTQTIAPKPLTVPSIMRKDYNSDSDAAAIAILSMKEGATVLRSSDSESTSASSRYKRKACSPLPNANGKRKMSFATILN
ncbi:hypothetical protein Poli38472_009095 [Pythium oligandrum]|uniref:SPX domain-containing protein n=1 Tax=Pythium oligandrum TaxID=41045 RepID=A0A8K1CMA7_PYTOL|nr:hypothetical protein Poli38472_009095 [Pythium oligandrum]|eukprot:TMW64928.1 hypothetical protein Poli38472_009095 [Pythium oligandrum]